MRVASLLHEEKRGMLGGGGQRGLLGNGENARNPVVGWPGGAACWLTRGSKGAAAPMNLNGNLMKRAHSPPPPPPTPSKMLTGQNKLVLQF